jgi:2-dehydro-3-deoxygluconokinase
MMVANRRNEFSLQGEIRMKHESQPEVVTFGESMALMTPLYGAGLEEAGTLVKSFGGAESNVAIGLARLGHRAGWFGLLGDDPMGKYVLKKIRGEGVDVSRARLSGQAQTGLMLREERYGKTSVYYYRSASAARLIRPDDLDADYIAGARILHITGITPALSESCRETVFAALEIARREKVKVCFDPNLRLKLWPIEQAREVIWRLAQTADYFLPGLDELSHLFPGEDEEALFNRLRELPGVSVVKGSGTTYVLENGNAREVEWFPVQRVVDPIGAGDGFCAGFLSGILRGWSLAEAARLGNLVGSIVVQHVGDWEALPDKETVESILFGRKHVER